MNFLIYMGYILIAVLVLLLMITIHELGHYIAGRVLKFKINEFAIGFGPRLWSRVNKRGETVSLRAFPLGGFCAFYGEENAGEQKLIDPFAEVEPQQDERKELYFTEQKPWKRIIVFVAGATFNIVSAFFFTFLFLLIVGYSVPSITSVRALEDGSVNPNSAIILQDDIIVAVNGTPIDALHGYDELMSGVDIPTLTLTVERNGSTIELSGFEKVVYKYTDDDGVTKTAQGIGLAGEYFNRPVSFATASWQTFPMTWRFGTMVLRSFGGIFTGEVSLADMTGPVGTIGVMATFTRRSILNLFILLPIIAVNLGVFNLFPIPALDGAKVVFTVIEWIRRKPVKPEIENMIHFAGLILLLGFVIFVDVFNLIS